jgi:Ca2+-binding RTX toxin-like protein
MRRGPALVLTLLVAALLAESSPASEVHVEERKGKRVLVYTGGPGERNAPSIGRNDEHPGKITVRDGPWFDDSGEWTLEAGAGCERADDHWQDAVCREDVDAVHLSLGDENDRVAAYRLGAIEIFVRGEAGDDQLDFPFGFEQTGLRLLNGGSGDDLLVGDAQSTRLRGGPGADVLHGGAGADTISGGRGKDTVVYGNQFSFEEPAVVFVTLNGRGPDGALGERDRILADVEGVTGGSAGDELVGGRGPNTIAGEAGDDDIDGGGGRDVLDGGRGDDRVRARDGRRDVVGCGGGNGDRAFVDQFDDVGVECEVIRLRRVRPRR